MKKGFFRKPALIGAAVMVTGVLAACGGSTTDETQTESLPTEVTESLAEQTDTAETDTMVVGYAPFSGKFSPFFASTAYDNDVVKMVSVSLLDNDREGNMVLNGIAGTTIPYNGTEYTYYGIADSEITENADGTVYYDFTIRDDIVFSDGIPMTIDDVIFSMYVFADPTYDGNTTFFAQPIVGMEEYRGGVSTLTALMLQMGRDNTDFTYFTEEQQKAFWTAFDGASDTFLQEIIDYCVSADAASLPLVGNSEVALGMVDWGFGSANKDGTVVTGAVTGTEHETANVAKTDFMKEMLAKYKNDLTALSTTESAGSDLSALLYAGLGDTAADYQKGISTGESAAYIEGIQKTGDYSVRVVLEKVDAAAIYRLPVTVAPLHYYGDTTLYDYENHMFGFTKGDLSGIKAKTTAPLGAGPYVFESYENGVVTFTANENYYLGAPQVETILFKETDEADKLTGIVAGTFDISDPSMSVTVLENIKSYNANSEMQGNVLYTSLVDNLGYGYIGINSDNVKVGEDKRSEASKNLRKAFATLFAVYRDTAVKSYYGEMATIIQYPISNTSWAAPKPADEGYRQAYSVDVEGNAVYTADMTEEEKYAAALKAAVGFFKAAGYTYDEGTGMFTVAPEGAEMTYEVIIPADGVGNHPAFGILTAAKEALSTIGITLEINDPSDANYIWTVLEAGQGEMFVAAWSATQDPDMYQIYHSTNVVGEGGTDNNHYAIQDEELDSLILAARNSTDQSYRKATYKQCMDIILDWGVEIPTYQRQNAIVFSAERVDMSTVTPDITTFWGWMNDIQNLRMK